MYLYFYFENAKSQIRFRKEKKNQFDRDNRNWFVISVKACIRGWVQGRLF